jgi:type II secretory pathway pseudopilin PulG
MEGLSLPRALARFRTPPPRRSREHGCPEVRGEAGLTIVELLVAMVIFAMVALSLAYTLQMALLSTRDDRNRVQAAHLAARELEIARNEFGSTSTGPATLGGTSVVTNPHQLPGGTAGQPLKVDGTTYTVVRKVEWLPAGTGSSPCDGGSAVNYPSLGVNVKVTWTAMHGTPAVESNTILTPPKGTLNTGMAFVAAKILGASGTGLGGIAVTLTGPGGSPVVTTADDGCAVFALTTMGSYTATIGSTGYVTFDGQPGSSKSGISVTAGTLQQVNFTYDQAATLVVALPDDHHHARPAPLPGLVYFNPGLVPLGTRTVTPGAASTTIGSLWPFSDGYSVWAGTCKQSDPATTGGSRPSPVVVPPGSSRSVVVPLAELSLDITTIAGAPLPGYKVVATPADGTGCAPAETSLALGAADSDGTLLTSLPGGVWELAVTDPGGAPKTLDGGAATEPTPALVADGPETAMTLRVQP